MASTGKKGGGRHDGSPVRDRRQSGTNLAQYEPRTVDYVNPLFPREEHHGERSRSTIRETGVSASNLAEPEQDFVRNVPYCDLKGCVEYLQKHQELLKRPNALRDYRDEAIAAFRRGDRDRAENCAEKAIFVGECKKHAQDLRRYLRDLLLEKKEQQAFDRKMRTLIEICEKEADEADQARHPHHGRDDLPLGVASLRISPPGVTEAGGRHGPQPFAKARDHLQNPRNYDHGSGRGAMPRRHTLKSSSRRSVGSSQGAPHLADLASQDYEASICGGKSVSPIHERFRVRKDASRFYRVGRVFAIITYERDTSRFGITKDEITHIHAKTQRGDDVIGHVSRMIVVKECHGYCWAICINSYGGRGVGKKGFSQADIDSHAIAYGDGASPATLKEEPAIRKDPICIDLVEGETLNMASRICFAKPHSIEYNLPVSNIGKIAEKSMPFFRAYCREHLTVESVEPRLPAQQERPEPRGDDLQRRDSRQEELRRHDSRQNDTAQHESRHVKPKGHGSRHK